MAGQDDDDEFERLLNDFIATQLEDVEDEPAKKEPPQPAPKAEAPRKNLAMMMKTMMNWQCSKTMKRLCVQPCATFSPRWR